MSRPAPDATRPRPRSSPAQLLSEETRAVLPPARRRRRAPAAPKDAPAAKADPDWDALEPRGAYARLVRPALELALVLALLPLALALALPIALGNLLVFRDPRLVLFTQERVGHRGRVFRIHKFRTMKEVRGSAFDSWSQGGDALRVTRFGRFLRNSHLDELPQLLDVLTGRMSLIGPRPEMVEIEDWANQVVPGFRRRLAVRPGITGWAQVTQGYVGRCAEAYRHKHALSMHYLERFGPRQDLEILARTALWMLRRRGWRWREQAAAASPAHGVEERTAA